MSSQAPFDGQRPKRLSDPEGLKESPGAAGNCCSSATYQRLVTAFHWAWSSVSSQMM
jgi:hypothetical protein